MHKQRQSNAGRQAQQGSTYNIRCIMTIRDDPQHARCSGCPHGTTTSQSIDTTASMCDISDETSSRSTSPPLDCENTCKFAIRQRQAEPGVDSARLKRIFR